MATVTLELPTDHPGSSDAAYRERRAAIVEACREYEPGQPIPEIAYSAEEDEVWRTVSRELAAKHRRVACAAYLEGSSRLALPAEHVPQLREVDRRLRLLGGFRIRPVAGLVPAHDFYGSLAGRTFLSTQYVRHHSVPFYTPEPDLVHEVIGHATSLAWPGFALLYEKAGRASLRSKSAGALDFFSKVFWFTLEFGVLRESGVRRAYGAGLLSSYGELEALERAEIRPWDIAAMGTVDYDITRYQPVLFEAPSFERMAKDLGGFFDAFGDEWYARHVQGAPR